MKNTLFAFELVGTKRKGQDISYAVNDVNLAPLTPQNNSNIFISYQPYPRLFEYRDNKN